VLKTWLKFTDSDITGSQFMKTFYKLVMKDMIIYFDLFIFTVVLKKLICPIHYADGNFYVFLM
jgi:hypothetical protein